MKKMKILTATLPGTLIALIERLKLLGERTRFARCFGRLVQNSRRGTAPVPLANALGLFGEKSEVLFLDPNSTYNSGTPWPGATSQATRFRIVQRGASGYQYGDLAQGTNLPLGVTPDAPYNSSDPFTVYRFGAHVGLFLGVSATAVTIDHLVYATANGEIADLSLAANGTYWVVGRAAATIAAGADLGEVPFMPCVPYQLTVTGGVFTYPTNPT